MNLRLDYFDYSLPKALIAQHPLEERDAARLMVLDRKEKTVTDDVFSDILEYMEEGDCLVLNDTRVLSVRLYGKRETGAKVEIFLLNPASNPDEFKGLIRPSKRVKEGERIRLENGEWAIIGGRADLGRFVRFSSPAEEILKMGHVPLPPYISRDDTVNDREAYQTVYARNNGATASPTAGLHFTKKLLDELKKKGVKLVHVTLHTSYGTFAPVTSENIVDHVMHAEDFRISEKSAKIINDAKSAGKKIFAVGTTALRALESAAVKSGRVESFSGETKLFIYPGYEFKIVDSIVTNFHLPKSTLLILVSAFAGRDFIFDAYKRAIEKKYRFFSYGDAMLIK